MASINEKAGASGHVLKTPIWVVVIRGFQVFLALVILALAGRLMHDAYLDEEGLALAIGLITWFVVAYILISEKVSAAHQAYNIIAVLVLDGVMMVLWLATFAAAAARRATFTVDVGVDGCFDDGSTLDSKTCNIVKRGVILFKSGAAMLAAIAGLGALVWLLFIAVFVWEMIMFFRGRKEGRFQFATSSENYQMEAGAKPAAQSQPLMNQPTGYAPQAQYPAQPTEYQPQGQTAYQQPQSPYQQQESAYPPPQGTYQPTPPQQQAYAYPPQEQQPVQPLVEGGYQAPAQYHQGSELAGSEGHPYTGGYQNSTSPPPPQNYQ